MAKSWKDIPGDTKEKYSLYLCSREWSEIREKVRARAAGYCERCQRHPMDACHHLTYERKYEEEMEDLQGICTGCHEFTHGKSNYDPREGDSEEWVRYVRWSRFRGLRPVNEAVVSFEYGLQKPQFDVIRYCWNRSLELSHISDIANDGRFLDQSAIYLDISSEIENTINVNYTQWLPDKPIPNDWDFWHGEFYGG